MFLSIGCVVNGQNIRYSMTQTTVQQPYARSGLKQLPDSHIGPQGRADYVPAVRGTSSESSDADTNARADFSKRIQGGTVVSFDVGLIIVRATEQPESLRPTALTTDAIITSAVRSKMAAQPQLQSLYFSVRTDGGVVKIDAPAESLGEAAIVINIALTVPEVRQIVYTIQSTVKQAPEPIRAGLFDFLLFTDQIYGVLGQSNASPAIRNGNPSRIG